MNLKPLSEQVIVLTGASSGIGLATARMAAGRGARLMLAARSEQALQQLTQEITDGGGQAVFVVADVSRQEDVERIVALAHEVYGGFDTWINNAGVGMYGPLMELNEADMRRLFDVNFWGLVYGSRAAVAGLRERGGALINVGSVASEQAIPLQGLYSASKHAVKGYTDALRMELEHEQAPVSVTLIMPAAIDTPFPLHARNYLDSEPQHVPPVYAPEPVARAILHAAETPVREAYVGGGGKAMASFGNLAPGAADRAMAAEAIPGTASGRPRVNRNILYQPSGELEERGDYPGKVQNVSVYNQATRHRTLIGLGLLGVGVAALWSLSQRE